MNRHLKSLYRDTLLKHSRQPRNRQALPEANATAQLKNPLCGDLVSIHLAIEDKRITNASFEAQCCSICMASASMLTDKVHGTAVDDSLSFANALIETLSDSNESLDLPEDEDLIALSGVKAFPSRIRCATLPWEAMLAALAEERMVKSEE